MRKILVKGWHIEMRSDDSATKCGILRSDDAHADGKIKHRGSKKTGGYYRIVVHG